MRAGERTPRTCLPANFQVKLLLLVRGPTLRTIGVHIRCYCFDWCYLWLRWVYTKPCALPQMGITDNWVGKLDMEQRAQWGKREGNTMKLSNLKLWYTWYEGNTLGAWDEEYQGQVGGRQLPLGVSEGTFGGVGIYAEAWQVRRCLLLTKFGSVA